MLINVLRAAGFGALLALAACSPATMLNALVPDGDYTLQADRSYGADARQTLDVYIPTAPASVAGPRPVVVFFYGGNWRTGQKKDYRFVGQALASRGFIAVVPDYRLYPQIRYPDFLRDSAAAVRWTLDNLAALGGDPARVHLMGHSAGAYNAAMLALDDRWLGPARDRIRSMVGLAGPYDFLPLTDPKLQDMFATEPDLRRTQPIVFADAKGPPLFLLHGTADDVVEQANSVKLAARLRAQGAQVEEKYYDGMGHIRIVGALAAPLQGLAPVLDDVVGFLRRN